MCILVGQQQDPAKQQACNRDKEKGRKDPPDATAVEVAQTKGTTRESVEDVSCDQEPGDHKEDVHTNKASGQQLWKGVVAQDRKDSDGPKPVHIRAVGAGSRMCGHSFSGLSELVVLANRFQVDPDRGT